ncbi:Hypothetical protein CINCED_3A008231 [Cinara cedri]|uniref:Uncharacterized protein n=1 Tax=Cinara cedri TaxID=506608 RepID=A0A5E4MH70_9HEMI|nr:Hypothetical protein CINCED_3A008231 [Cinara cedri]
MRHKPQCQHLFQGFINSDSDNDGDVITQDVSIIGSEYIKNDLKFLSFLNKKREMHMDSEVISVSTPTTSTFHQKINSIGLDRIQIKDESVYRKISDTGYVSNLDNDIINNCDLTSKTYYSCSFEPKINIGHEDFKCQMVVSLGHQLCRLSADFYNFKSQMNYLKLELTLFVGNKDILSQNNTFN